MAAFVASWARRAAVNKKAGGWEEVEDSERMLKLMLSSVERNTTISNPTSELETLDLLGTASSAAGSRPLITDCSTSTAGLPPAATLPPTSVSLDLDAPLPPGCQKCLDLQTGRIYYLNQNNGSTPTLSPSKRLSNAHISYSTPAIIDGNLGRTLDVDPNLTQSASLSKRSGTLQRDGSYQITPTSDAINVFEVDLNSPPLQELAMDANCRISESARAADMMTVGCANCLMFVMLSTTDPRCPNCGSCAALDFLQPASKRAKQA